MSAPGKLQEQTIASWPLWFWGLSIGAPIVFLGLMHYLENRHDLPELWQVTHAEYIPSNASSPPPYPPHPVPTSDTTWNKIEMPRNVLGDWQKPTSGWLRIALPRRDLFETVTSHSKDWMLVIPKPNNANFSLWLSGVRFVAAGSHDPGITSMPSNPITMEFPQLALQENDRHIYLQVTNELGGIDPNGFYLGPSHALRHYAGHITFVKKTSIRTILEMMAIMAIVNLFLHWLHRKRTNIYGWYALSISFWFMHTLHAQHESAAFGSVWFWYRASYLTLAAYVLSAMVFINRLTERPQPRLEVGLLLLFLAGSAFILIDPVGLDGIARFNALLWMPAIIAVGLHMLIRLALAARRKPTAQTLLLLGVTFLGLCVGVRDYLYNNLQLVPGGMLYLRHAAGLILVAFSFVLIRRFATDVQTINNHESAQLTAQSDYSARELQKQNSPASINLQLNLLQQEHDDLEHQLQQAVLITESSEDTAQFNNNMRAARHDLQLIRDMINRGEDAPPANLLESMQVRLSKSSRRQRVKLNWEIPLVLDTAFLRGHYELALARFVQTATLEALAFESVAEVLVSSLPLKKHNAMQVSVGAFFEPQPSSASQQSTQSPREVFSKRAQLEAAARALNGKLNFLNVASHPNRDGIGCKVELEWQAPP